MTKILDVATRPQIEEILSSIEEGNEVVLMRGGRKIAEVKPAQETEMPRKKRVLGLGVGGKFYMSDDFDDELPDAFWLGEE